MKNVAKASEILVGIWSRTVIDVNATVAEYIYTQKQMKDLSSKKPRMVRKTCSREPIFAANSKI